MAILIKSAQLSDKRRYLLNSKDGGSKDKSPGSSHPVNMEEKLNETYKPDTNANNNLRTPSISDENFIEKNIYLKEKERADTAEFKLSEYEKALLTEKQHTIDLGYKAGFEKGSKDGKKAYDIQMNRIAEILLDIEKKSERLLRDREGDIIEVVFLAISKIIGEAIMKRDGIREIVKRVTRDLNKNYALTVRVSPDDYALLNDTEFIGSQLNGESSYKLIKDDRILHGGCIVESQTGSLDARLETQFEILKESLLHAKYQHDMNVKS